MNDVIGRNEPCPCGSGKKYKRCCGTDAAPKLNAPKNAFDPAAAGLDPEIFKSDWMTEFTNAFKRLPKGQVQQLQQMMQRAMAGEDVSRESQALERVLPAEFQALMQRGPFAQAAAAQAAGAAGMQPQPDANPDLSEDQAKKIVEQAVMAGKLSKKEAENLIGTALPEDLKEGSKIPQPSEKKESKFSKLWGGMLGKKS